MKLIIDTFGADKGAEEIIHGTIDAMRNKSFEPIFIGDRKIIEKILEEEQMEDYNYRILHSEVQIDHGDSPTMALRQKKDSSLVMGLRLLKEEGDGMISCGSTGALLAGGTLIVKRMAQVKRPAIVLNFPTLRGNTIFLDAGANTDCTPQLLNTFAKIANIYGKEVLEKESPEVYLLNIGAEEGKGDELRLNTYDIMAEESYNFKGNIEARDIFLKGPDIVITDGFTGNMVLKTTEGVATAIMGLLKDAIHQTKDQEILKAMGKVQGLFDYNKTGAAPILGVKKPLFKAHGSSSRKAFKQGIYTMIDFIEKKVNEKIEENLKEES
ncbi:MAG: phosphate acyltransferase PlsX [Tissierellia bacterium]|nr:phosphate acyltransferase PlsX [Tissierellia bacterium]